MLVLMFLHRRFFGVLVGVPCGMGQRRVFLSQIGGGSSVFTTRITNILDGKHTGHWAQGQDIVDYIYLHMYVHVCTGGVNSNIVANLNKLEW